MRALLVGLVATVLVSACGAAVPTSTPILAPMRLSIQNGTTIPVALAVNGTVVESVAPGGYEDPVKAPMPPLPWSVETRSPSGRVLSSMTVNAGDAWFTTPDPSGASEAKGDAVRVDLACGRLDVWVSTPMGGRRSCLDRGLATDPGGPSVPWPPLPAAGGARGLDFATAG